MSRLWVVLPPLARTTSTPKENAAAAAAADDTLLFAMDAEQPAEQPAKSSALKVRKPCPLFDERFRSRVAAAAEAAQTGREAGLRRIAARQMSSISEPAVVVVGFRVSYT
jgi:hypothetical protein